MVKSKTDIINQILVKCMDNLSSEQIGNLKQTLEIELYGYELIPLNEEETLPMNVNDYNMELFKKYLIAKTLQNLSEKSLQLYSLRIKDFLININCRIDEVDAEMIRYYLIIKKQNSGCTNTTLENVRLCLSSFFCWLHNEEYISKNPMLKISSIKKDTIKEKPFSIQQKEQLRIACKTPCERALIEFMLSTGCRVSEIVSVNRNQIDFCSKQLTVIGKGNKPRVVYLKDKALVYLNIYLNSRTDTNIALFVSDRNPHNRLEKDAIEAKIRTLGERADVPNTHPHRFRRTLCCDLINRGMPIQDVSAILGHSKLDTTMIYFNNSDENISNKFKALN